MISLKKENRYRFPGFRRVKTDVTFVRYELPPVFVNVYHGRGSFELGVEIGRRNKQLGLEERFTLADIIQLAGAQEETEHAYTFSTSIQTSTAEGIRKSVPKLAEWTKKYAGPALKNNPEIFQQLQTLQKQNSDKLLKKWHLDDIRQKVGEAWRKKDFRLVVRLYESMQEDLTPAEAKKMEYAKGIGIGNRGTGYRDSGDRIQILGTGYSNDH